MKRYLSIKKILAILLPLAMLLAVFSACASEEPMEPAGEVSDLSEEKHFGIGDILQNDNSVEESAVSGTEESTVSTEESSQAASQTQSSQGVPSQGSGTADGEFIVSEKKYTYKNENLMLLNVENKTDKHYDVTINGKYLDQTGNTIKEESQTYIAFPSGWSNYFIFRPKGTFDSFVYSIQVKEYDSANAIYCYNGEPLSTYVDITYTKELYWGRGANTDLRDLMIDAKLVNRHSNVTIGIDCHVLVLDAQGEIYAMDYEFYDGWGTPVACFTNTEADPPGGAEFDGNFRIGLKTQAKGEDETIPADIQGNFTVIFAIATIVNYRNV